MSLQRKIKKRTERRAARVRGKMLNEQGLVRVSVFRSLKHIYAQIINDSEHKTVASCCSLDLPGKVSGSKKEVAHAVGIELAKRAKSLGIEAAIFDRGSFLYHGRVQAVAEGLREGGIKI